MQSAIFCHQRRPKRGEIKIFQSIGPGLQRQKELLQNEAHEKRAPASETHFSASLLNIAARSPCESWLNSSSERNTSRVHIDRITTRTRVKVHGYTSQRWFGKWLRYILILDILGGAIYFDSSAMTLEWQKHAMQWFWVILTRMWCLQGSSQFDDSW